MTPIAERFTEEFITLCEKYGVKVTFEPKSPKELILLVEFPNDTAN